MTRGDDSFTSEMVGSKGLWPPPPEMFSYSALREIERCPNQWMLRRARFPEFWDQAGYPDLPVLPAVFGDVLHLTLETIIRGMVGSGCTDSSSVEAVAVLRNLGGLTAVISSAIGTIVSALERNPRAGRQLPGIRQALTARTPELRRRTQAMLARARLMPGFANRSQAPAQHVDDRGLASGSFAEITLRAKKLSWLGRVDLLTLSENECRLVDYKTGAEHESHQEQVRVYALLWFLDHTLNPNGRFATELVVCYPNHDMVVEAPGLAELAALRAGLERRTETARDALASRPPLAIPDAQSCPLCPVRHLCAEYWSTFGAAPQMGTGSEYDGFGDFQLVVNQRNGPRSWLCRSSPQTAGKNDDQILVFAGDPELALELGSTVRLLNGRFHREPENYATTVTVADTSEIYTVRSS